MKIAVCIKQVPSRDSQPHVEGNAISEPEQGYEINEPDAYALEEALRLREAAGGEVVLVSVGPERVGSTLREALAKGADRAIHIEHDGSGLDPLATGSLLAKALQSEPFDLVLTGLQSADLGYGQTGVVVAELMGIPHATLVLSVEASGQTLKVKRELENGFFQFVELPTPALLTIQSGGNRLRYATLMGIKKARTKEVRKVTLAELGIVPAPIIQTERMYVPERSKEAQVFGGDPREAAALLVQKLKFEARVL